MRKYLALALAGVLTVALANFAYAADSPQSLDVQLTPTKLDKKKYSPAQIVVDVATTADKSQNPNLDQPPSATRTQVDFTSNLKFDSDAVDKCKVDSSALTNTTTQQAIDACGKSSQVTIDSGSSGQVTFDPSPASPDTMPIVVPVVITGFNGNKEDTLYLHSRVDSLNNTTILTGKLVNGPSGFGKTLDVTIPPLDAGAISDFLTTVKAGKYVQARCKSKTNNFQARSTYSNHPDTTATDSTTCKQKKSKKKGGKK